MNTVKKKLRQAMDTSTKLNEDKDTEKKQYMEEKQN